MPSDASSVECAVAYKAAAEPEDLVLRIDGSQVFSRSRVGGKAHGISKIRAAGLPTPPAFVVTVDACGQYFENADALICRLRPKITDGIRWLETESGHTFGSGPMPLLVSVRSGAPASMPGMMDTVLNLGINDEVEAVLAVSMGETFARDTHRRFRELFREVVAPPSDVIPADPYEQLHAAVRAVFDSWNSPRARSYRRYRNLEGTMAGTAVTVQTMVFGNLDDRSGTGVLFSRNPMTGDRGPFGEWLPGGQGLDVVGGKVDPLPLDELARRHPEIYTELIEAARWLESDAGDVQDIEFTIESGQLFFLQTRTAKRSARAAVRLAVALRTDGLIDTEEALSRISPAQVDALLTPVISPSVLQSATVVARGVPACPGVGAGVVVNNSDAAQDAADDKQDVVLARETTSPGDVSGMIAATAVITELGGSTSHAAVVSRELHRPCVVGCGKGTVTALAGSPVTVDGGRGTVYAGILPLSQPSETSDPDLATLLQWARARSPVTVYGPGEAPTDTTVREVDHREPETVNSALAGAAKALSAPHPLPVLLMILTHAQKGDR